MGQDWIKSRPSAACCTSSPSINHRRCGTRVYSPFPLPLRVRGRRRGLSTGLSCWEITPCRELRVSLIVGLGLGLLLLPSTWVQATEPKELRVCADPDNLPYSNEKLEGFENKIAALIAQDLGAKLTYTWWPHQRGLIRRTLNDGRCDVLIGIPKGYDPVLWTKPYYRTTYVIASEKNRGPEIASMDYRILPRVRIGVHVNTPPVCHDEQGRPASPLTREKGERQDEEGALMAVCLACPHIASRCVRDGHS